MPTLNCFCDIVLILFESEFQIFKAFTFGGILGESYNL